MKIKQPHRSFHRVLVTGLLVAFGAASAFGQFTFNSGSDGSYGALNITSNTTLALPTNGIFHCTTITVASNVTLDFTSNPLIPMASAACC